MSIARLVDIHAERHAPRVPTLQLDQDQTDTGAAQTSRDDAPSRVKTAIEALAAYIPTEVVGIYMVGLATIAALAQVDTWWWALFIGCILSCWFFTWAGWKARRREDKFEDLPFPKWALFAAMVAFVAWALAIPDSPVIGDDVRPFMGFLALAVSLGLQALEAAYAPPKPE